LRGAEVVMAVRSLSSGLAVKNEIVKEIENARLHVLQLDLSSLSSVRNFVNEFKSLNLPLNILM
jgi:WW domain-containing oxidoreductase